MTHLPSPGSVLLGTVAIEPNRWSTVDSSGAPVADLASLADRLSGLPIDGLEVWERHVPVTPPEASAVVEVIPPVVVLNSYIGFDAVNPVAVRTVVDRVAATEAGAVKFNVGNDAVNESLYVDRVGELASLLPDDVALLCECHAHISIAEEPPVAARMLDAMGPPDRFGAIVHTHESPEHLRKRFDAYGERIRHVHVNFLDQSTMTVPVLADRRVELEKKVALLRDLGFRGSWTLEFVEGVLTERDEPGAMLTQAASDLAVLHEVLGHAPTAG